MSPAERQIELEEDRRKEYERTYPNVPELQFQVMDRDVVATGQKPGCASHALRVLGCPAPVHR